MSLVAVVTRRGDRPSEVPETQVVPVGMAQDTDFGAYFRRQGLATRPPLSRMSKPAKKLGGLAYSLAREGGAAYSRVKEEEDAPMYSRSSVEFSRLDETLKVHMDAYRCEETAEDFLIDLASHMDSDGGMPGDNLGSRAIATVVALLAFLSQDHGGGAFRSHVARLVSFLKSLTDLPSQRQKVVAAVIVLAGKDTAPAGEWIALARTSGDHWKEVERSVLSE